MRGLRGADRTRSETLDLFNTQHAKAIPRTFQHPKRMRVSRPNFAVSQICHQPLSPISCAAAPRTPEIALQTESKNATVAVSWGEVNDGAVGASPW